VNGFESPEKYARHLQEIGDKLERKAMMFQSRLTTHYRPGFLKDIRWKLKDLHEKLIMEEAGENGNASSLPADGKSWYFRSAVVRVGPVQYTDPGIIASVKDSLNAYARVWHLAFQRVKSRLNVLRSWYNMSLQAVHPCPMKLQQSSSSIPVYRGLLPDAVIF